ncbi:MAG TPA: aldo/keto reductase, partial [Roseiflexaceae bacterium]|nr:aldo/keto reductase [Roseiflexaceae bacterium]
SKVVLPAEVHAAALRPAITESVETTLRQLQTDVIDLLQIHSASVEVIQQGMAIEVLEDLRRAGWIRFIGVTTYSAEASLAAIADRRYDCLQIAYNLLDRRPEPHVLPQAQAADIGVLVRSVLLKGALTHRSAHLPDALHALRAAAACLNTIADQYALPLPALAYRYVLDHPAVASALIGTARSSELIQACGFVELPPLPHAIHTRLREITIGDVQQLDPSTWPL